MTGTGLDKIIETGGPSGAMRHVTLPAATALKNGKLQGKDGKSVGIRPTGSGNLSPLCRGMNLNGICSLRQGDKYGNLQLKAFCEVLARAGYDKGKLERAEESFHNGKSLGEFFANLSKSLEVIIEVRIRTQDESVSSAVMEFEDGQKTFHPEGKTADSTPYIKVALKHDGNEWRWEWNLPRPRIAIDLGEGGERGAVDSHARQFPDFEGKAALSVAARGRQSDADPGQPLRFAPRQPDGPPPGFQKGQKVDVTIDLWNNDFDLRQASLMQKQGEKAQSVRATTRQPQEVQEWRFVKESLVPHSFDRWNEEGRVVLSETTVFQNQRNVKGSAPWEDGPLSHEDAARRITQGSGKENKNRSTCYLMSGLYAMMTTGVGARALNDNVEFQRDGKRVRVHFPGFDTTVELAMAVPLNADGTQKYSNSDPHVELLVRAFDVLRQSRYDRKPVDEEYAEPELVFQAFGLEPLKSKETMDGAYDRNPGKIKEGMKEILQRAAQQDWPVLFYSHAHIMAVQSYDENTETFECFDPFVHEEKPEASKPTQQQGPTKWELDKLAKEYVAKLNMESVAAEPFSFLMAPPEGVLWPEKAKFVESRIDTSVPETP